MKYLILLFISILIVSCGGGSKKSPVLDTTHSGWSTEEITTVKRTYTENRDGREYNKYQRLLQVTDASGAINLIWEDERGLVVSQKREGAWLTEVFSTFVFNPKPKDIKRYRYYAGLTVVEDSRGEPYLLWEDDSGFMTASKQDGKWVPELISDIQIDNDCSLKFRQNFVSCGTRLQTKLKKDGSTALFWEDDRGLMTAYYKNNKWTTVVMADVEQGYRNSSGYKLVSNGNGNIAAWWEDDRGLMSVYSTDGETWNEPEKVAYGGRQYRETKHTRYAHGIMDHEGNFMILWRFDSLSLQSKYFDVDNGWGDIEDLNLGVNDLGDHHFVASSHYNSNKFAFDDNGNLIYIFPFYSVDGGGCSEGYDLLIKTYTKGLGWNASGKDLLLRDKGYFYGIQKDSDNNIIVVAESVEKSVNQTEKEFWLNSYQFGIGWGTAEIMQVPTVVIGDSYDPMIGCQNLIGSTRIKELALNENGNAVFKWYVAIGDDGNIKYPAREFFRVFKQSNGWGEETESESEKPSGGLITDLSLSVGIGVPGIVTVHAYSNSADDVSKYNNIVLGRFKGAERGQGWLVDSYSSQNAIAMGKIIDSSTGDYQFWTSQFSLAKGWASADVLPFVFSDSYGYKYDYSPHKVLVPDTNNGFSIYWIDDLNDGSSVLRHIKYNGTLM